MAKDEGIDTKETRQYTRQTERLGKHFLFLVTTAAQIRVVNERRKIHKTATVRSLSPKLNIYQCHVRLGYPMSVPNCSNY